jgi:hypothetical protein
MTTNDSTGRASATAILPIQGPMLPEGAGALGRGARDTLCGHVRELFLRIAHFYRQGIHAPTAKRPRKNPVLLPKTIAQICRLKVHLLTD